MIQSGEKLRIKYVLFVYLFAFFIGDFYGC